MNNPALPSQWQLGNDANPAARACGPGPEGPVATTPTLIPTPCATKRPWPCWTAICTPPGIRFLWAVGERFEGTHREVNRAVFSLAGV